MAGASVKSPIGKDTPLRPVKLGPADVAVERRSDGAILMRSPHPLDPYANNITARLAYWATVAPDRIFLAQRDAAGGWRTMTYRQTLASVRAIAASLLERNLSPERPIIILSGNDLEHAMLGLAAMHVGIPYAPISVPYSLMSQDFGKLKSIVNILTPGLAFAASGKTFAPIHRRTGPLLCSQRCARSQPKRSTPRMRAPGLIRWRKFCSRQARPGSQRA
jgi:feruloyl-CoA synthase